MKYLFLSSLFIVSSCANFHNLNRGIASSESGSKYLIHCSSSNKRMDSNMTVMELADGKEEIIRLEANTKATHYIFTNDDNGGSNGDHLEISRYLEVLDKHIFVEGTATKKNGKALVFSLNIARGDLPSVAPISTSTSAGKYSGQMVIGGKDVILSCVKTAVD